MNQQFFTPEVEEANKIKEMLRNESWEEIKKKKEIFLKFFSPDIEANEVNPFTMLLAERSLALDFLFENYQKIPSRKATSILKFFTESDTKNLEPLKTKVKGISPDIEMKALDESQLLSLQQEDKSLVNGLMNAKMLSLIKITEEISSDIRIVKNLPPDQISDLLNQISDISNGIQANLKQYKDPTKEQVESVASFLEKIGRTKFEIDNLKESDNLIILIDVFQRTKEALEVVQQAQKDNLVNQLDNQEVVVQLLEKINQNKNP